MIKRKEKIIQGDIMMLLAGILLCLVMISTHFTSGLYARYSTVASGSDSARVIKFGQLTVTTDTENGKNIVFAPGAHLKNDIKISFGGSEASTIIFVAINAQGWTVTNNVNYKDSKGQLSWSVADDWEFLEGNGNVYVYYKELTPNTVLNNYGFIKDGEIKVSENGTLEIYKEYPETPETKFSVRGYAVQANGFDTVEKAWKSVNK